MPPPHVSANHLAPITRTDSVQLVLLFPGQGSQRPGMGKDLADAFPQARDAFERVDEALGEPLSRLCFAGPAAELTLTHNAQPALLAHGAAVWAVLRDALGDHVRAAAGHSLGELTAYHAAGALGLSDAARLVRRRGALMRAAGEAQPGTMAAIVGTPSRSVDDICAEASASPQGGIVVPANFNSPTQTVVSGETAGVERAMELARAAGARAMRLSVDGAFHSPLMASARDGFAAALAGVDLAEPGVPVYANVSALPVRDAATARRLLVEQVTGPVRWTQIMAGLAAEYRDALFVELGPGSVLTGLTRKHSPGIHALTCGTAAEVDALLAMAPA